MQSLALLGNPLPPTPDGEMLFSIQWEKKNSRKPRAES